MTLMHGIHAAEKTFIYRERQIKSKTDEKKKKQKQKQQQLQQLRQCVVHVLATLHTHFKLLRRCSPDIMLSDSCGGGKGTERNGACLLPQLKRPSIAENT
jgi:hypothetical protein